MQLNSIHQSTSSCADASHPQHTPQTHRSRPTPQPSPGGQRKVCVLRRERQWQGATVPHLFFAKAQAFKLLSQTPIAASTKNTHTHTPTTHCRLACMGEQQVLLMRPTPNTVAALLGRGCRPAPARTRGALVPMLLTTVPCTCTAMRRSWQACIIQKDCCHR